MEQSTFKPVNYTNNSKLEDLFFGDYIKIIVNEMTPIHIRYDCEADIKYVADLVIELPHNNSSVEKAVGFRVRNYEYFKSYRNQFTLRKAELEKILTQGKGDYYLYGFCDADKRKLIQWTLFDLEVFRRKYNEFKGTILYDKDVTMFYAFWFWKFPEEMIIKQYTDDNYLE